LSPVAFIRRADTKGGVAPAAGCDAAHRGEAGPRVRYYALYQFFGAAEVTMTDRLKVALAQLNPKVGDVDGNLAKGAGRAH